jgi:SAM-dependent methyltransferase
MKEQGIASWFERTHPWDIDPHDRHFFMDLFAQTWMPRKGRVIEYGCGSGQFLRWICSRGFTGLGIDVSETAIELAMRVNDPLVRYRVADVCKMDPASNGLCDLCIDGRMSHFILSKADRRAFFRSVRDALKPDGVFVLMSMCGPIDTEELARVYPGQRVVDDVLYVPADYSHEGAIGEIHGASYAPQSYVPHWQDLIAEFKESGLEPVLIRYNRCAPGEPISSVNVAARLMPNGGRAHAGDDGS